MSKDARSVDALEHISSPGRFNRQLSIAGFRGDDKRRWASRGVVVGTQALRAPCRLFRPLLVKDLCDSNAVVGEDVLAAHLLNRMVLRIDPPSDHRSLVLPYLVREQEMLSIQALEPVEEQTAAHSFQGRLQ